MKFQDVDFLTLSEYTLELARQIRDSGYMPDHVLYVERVGLFLGHEMASYFNCSISGIYTSRSGASVKSALKSVLRYLPRKVTHLLRQVEIKSNIHGVQKERHAHIDGAFPPKNKNLLIVDDAVDTGSSLKVICDFLSAHGYKENNFKTAALTVTQPNTIVRPDFVLFEDIAFCFPWAYDSRVYNEAWKRYDELKSQL